MTKKICTIYANCQGAGVAHFLRKSKMAREYDFEVFQNYRLMLGEERLEDLLKSLARCELFIYQPTQELECRDGSMIPSTDELCQEAQAYRMSFAYQWNSGFFPIVESGKWWTGEFLVELAKSKTMNVAEIFRSNPELLRYDCARRFTENLAEQAQREHGCSIKMAPYILHNFQDRHLFLMHNHPTSILLSEIARRIVCDYWRHDEPISWADINEANLPGWHGLHPVVKNELGLKYDAPGGDLEYYHVLFRKLMEKPVL